MLIHATTIWSVAVNMLRIELLQILWGNSRGELRCPGIIVGYSQGSSIQLF